MWRYGVGAVSALLLVAAGFLVWSGLATRDDRLPAAPRLVSGQPPTGPIAEEEASAAPQATERTREQKRFDRYDRNKDEHVGRDEYLYARHRNFAKLDTNGDGLLSFDEYAAKAVAKFAGADADKSGALDRTEFATTRVVRKTRPRCPPVARERPVVDETDAG